MANLGEIEKKSINLFNADELKVLTPRDSAVFFGLVPEIREMLHPVYNVSVMKSNAPNSSYLFYFNFYYDGREFKLIRMAEEPY